MESISNEEFLSTDETKEDNFKSIRNIVAHIVRLGYIYSNSIRTSFSIEKTPVEIKIHSVPEALVAIDKMFQYKFQTYENKWLMTEDEMMKTIVKTFWTTYDLEAIIEHSIVHIIRHRLQIEKLLLRTT